MKKIVFIGLMCFISILSSGQADDPESWRQQGNLASDEGDYETAIYFYEKALDFFPEDIPMFFNLAKAYGYKGQLEDAISIYRKIIRIDDTWSEAWAGIGKMYYWEGKPATALTFYEKALELDPENEELRDEWLTVKSETDYGFALQFGPVNEKEENYEINAMISKVKFEKRINDHFKIDAGFLLDYSNRNYTGEAGDTTRWYDNTQLKGTWIGHHHQLGVFGGYSATDQKFSSYGALWKMNYSLGKIALKNSLQAGYDYFYYWNKVGGYSVSEDAGLTYRFIGLDARYTFGLNDPVYCSDYKTGDSIGIKENPYQSYGFSLNFRIIKVPEIKVGVSYSYLDYKYKSKLYYSPYGRRLTGAQCSVYYKYSSFYVYGNFAYNLGTEDTYSENSPGDIQKDKMNVDNWTANLELGYEYYPFSISIGGNSFYNPYYQNITGVIAVKVLF